MKTTELFRRLKFYGRSFIFTPDCGIPQATLRVYAGRNNYSCSVHHRGLIVSAKGVYVDEHKLIDAKVYFRIQNELPLNLEIVKTYNHKLLAIKTKIHLQEDVDFQVLASSVNLIRLIGGELFFPSSLTPKLLSLNPDYANNLRDSRNGTCFSCFPLRQEPVGESSLDGHREHDDRGTDQLYNDATADSADGNVEGGYQETSEEGIE
jgi:hypothetical protein